MDKKKALATAVIVAWSLVVALYASLFISEAKISYDVKQRGESYKTKTPYKAADNDVITKGLMQMFRSTYSKEYYDLAAELMGEGLYDPRPWTQDPDEEYCRSRYGKEPIHGEACKDWDDIVQIKTEGDVDDVDVEYVRACIKSMPQGFVKHMAEDGWTVILSAENNLTCDYDDKHDNMETIGQTNFVEKTINLVSSELYGTVYHEFGHVLEDYSKEPLDKAGLLDFNNGELSDLYNHTANGSLYIYLNPEEQLAESFYDYIFYPRETEKSAPTLYGIYKDTIDSYKNEFEGCCNTPQM